MNHKIYGDDVMIYDIIIVGAGASGLAAAIGAKRVDRKLNIAALDSMPRVGKKILATGNGRCNLSNLNAIAEKYTNPEFVAYALNEFTPEKVMDFFRSIGLLCVTDGEGRAYPMSNTASSVLDALRAEAERLGVEFICENHVDRIEKKNGIFTVGRLVAKRVIVCTGGCASPSQGSDGSGFDLLKSLGHHITEVYPGLVQLTVKENTKPLKGIRVKANVALFSGSKQIDAAKGEVLFTDYGLSGISVMDISRSVKSGQYTCFIDALPRCKTDEAESFLCSLSKNMPVESALSGMIPRSLGRYILKRTGINSLATLGELNKDKIREIINTAKKLSFTVTGTMGFKNAQISVGGANVKEFNSETMESKLVKGLFCAGEVLDTDSICGGFNLQWAWASGLLAGRCAATEK